MNQQGAASIHVYVYTYKTRNNLILLMAGESTSCSAADRQSVSRLACHSSGNVGSVGCVREGE